MQAVVAVAIGGAIGSVLRYLVGSAAAGLSPGGTIGTFAINVTGSLALGFLARLFGPAGSTSTLYLALAVGLCGGFTTFSTFTLEVFTLMERGQVARSLLYVVASVVVSYGALAAGFWAARGLRAFP